MHVLGVVWTHGARVVWRGEGACRAPKNGPSAALGRLPSPPAAALTALTAAAA